MDGSCEDGEQDFEGLELQAKELGFYPEGDGNPLNISEPENDTIQSLRED